MLRVSISALNKHRSFLPLLCHGSLLLGRCPLGKGPAEMHHHPLGAAGVAALMCAVDTLCYSPPLLAHKHSPQQPSFLKAFAHHLQKMLLWELHTGLALKLTSLSTC